MRGDQMVSEHLQASDASAPPLSVEAEFELDSPTFRPAVLDAFEASGFARRHRWGRGQGVRADNHCVSASLSVPSAHDR